MMNLDREIIIIRKKPQRKIHVIKNHSIWTSIHGTIKEQSKGRKINHEEREIDEIELN